LSRLVVCRAPNEEKGENTMSFRTLAIVTVVALSTWQAASGRSGTGPQTRARAEAKITVQSSEAKPYNQTGGPALVEVRLSETFTGDINGESPVRALRILRTDQSASLVSVQRFRGKLGERQGTFVLQGSEIVENGRIKATWFVFPG